MILKTADFQSVCKTISLAIDGKAANLELITKNNSLYLNVTNREYYTSIKFPINENIEFKAVVDASLFLDLISGLCADEFELGINDNYVFVKAGKSNYKLAMIYENDKLIELPVISITNKTVEMPISKNILNSILTVNSKELIKAKSAPSASINELQKLYYITNEGCFTFVTGSCLNKFTLDKPVQMLLNDRIVHLFKLFNDDVLFSMGHDSLSSDTFQTKVTFETDDIYLAAIVNNDDILFNKVQGPYLATKNFIEYNYPIKAVLSVNSLAGAISRLLVFTKNSTNSNNQIVMADINITNNEVTISDKSGNSEVISIENGSFIDNDYSMSINLVDIKLILDSCKDEYLTVNCGNQRSVIITRASIYNLIPEGVRQ